MLDARVWLSQAGWNEWWRNIRSSLAGSSVRAYPERSIAHTLSRVQLVEARRLSSPWQGASPATTQASARPSRADGHDLRPSTNGSTLSDLGE